MMTRSSKTCAGAEKGSSSVIPAVFLVVLAVCVSTALHGQRATSAENHPSDEMWKKWHPVTLTFTGPSAHERDANPNPFLDYRLNVTFTGPHGKQYRVPGYFAGDGAGGESGNVWKTHFTPDLEGTWTYTTSFRQGHGIAISLDPEAGNPIPGDGETGTFYINPLERDDAGFYRWGRLEYVNDHYLKFRDGAYWIKGGCDSPENFLAYDGFDNTHPNPDRPEFFHDYAPHVRDWREGDPDWGDGRGKGIIGSLNYLAARHINSLYILLNNIGGDGKDVWPYASKIDRNGHPDNDNLCFDISKLAQWEVVFRHAQQMGITLHLVLGESEKANKEELDNSALGVERKLYYREMVSRFGHHNAILWNLCEEYNLPGAELADELIIEWATYLKQIDPYRHPVTVHNSSRVFRHWDETFYGEESFDYISFQYTNNRRRNVPDYQSMTERLRYGSAASGRKLAVMMDELQAVTTVDEDAYSISENQGIVLVALGQQKVRKEILYPVLFSGGQVEWFLEEALKLNDFSPYEALWDYTWYARKFMEENLPFWDMIPADHQLIDATVTEIKPHPKSIPVLLKPQVLAKFGDVYAIYYPQAIQTGRLRMYPDEGEFSVRWYNPRSGEFEGKTRFLTGGNRVPVGPAPSDPKEDWVVLIEKIDNGNN